MAQGSEEREENEGYSEGNGEDGHRGTWLKNWGQAENVLPKHLTNQ